MRILALLLGLFLGSCSVFQKTSNAQYPSSDRLITDIKTLSSDEYAGRRTGTPGAAKAREYIINRFKEAGVKAYDNNFAIPFSFQSRGTATEGTNVIGYIQGTSDKVIVISGHYDHLGERNGKIFNGADDNASGVAGLLHMTRYFSKNKPYYTLIFAAFDAEEMGLQGAKAFVANPPVPVENIIMNVNMDMISHNDKGELYACGTYKYPGLKQFFTNKNADINVLLGHDDPKQGKDDWTNQSDQGAFNAKGIPFLYFGVEDHKDYHKDTDEFQNINQPFFINAANAVLEVVINLNKHKQLQAAIK